MTWTNINKGVPLDDQNVWVINTRVNMTPIKAYYLANDNEFLAMDLTFTCSLSITHWMPMQEIPND